MYIISESGTWQAFGLFPSPPPHYLLQFCTITDPCVSSVNCIHVDRNKLIDWLIDYTSLNTPHVIAERVIDYGLVMDGQSFGQNYLKFFVGMLTTPTDLQNAVWLILIFYFVTVFNRNKIIFKVSLLFFLGIDQRVSCFPKKILHKMSDFKIFMFIGQFCHQNGEKYSKKSQLILMGRSVHP